MNSLLFSSLKALKSFNFGDKLRGFRLFANKASSAKIVMNLHFSIEKTMKFSINMIKSQISQYITNESAIRLLNPLKSLQEKLESLDKQLLSVLTIKIANIRLKFFRENSAFSIESDTLRVLTPFLKEFQGFSFEGNEKIVVFLYAKECLSSICMDGVKYEDHLFFELRLQSLLNSSEIPSNFLNEFLGIYEKKMGLEASDKELYVLQKALNTDEFISLSTIISQNGGLIRIPFLAKTSAIGLLMKLWASEILIILQKLQEFGAILPVLKPENIYISRKNNEKIRIFGLKGVAQINEMGSIVKMPDISLFLSTKNGENTEENIAKDAYIAPEILMKNPLENTHYIQSWTFGCLLYEILFGKPPESCYSSLNLSKNSGFPSDFSHYEVFSEKIINEILRFDYDKNDNKSQFHDKCSLANAIEKKDFSGLFEGIFLRKNDETLAEIINIIALCLQFDAFKRPSISVLARSTLFKQDKYQMNSAKEYANSLSFFKSPSQNLKTRVLDPLIMIKQRFIDQKHVKIGEITDKILEIIEILCFSIYERGNSDKKLSELKKNIVGKVYENKEKDAFPWLDEDKKNLISEYQEIRGKLPNYGLVKFIFDYDILDILVFVILRYQKAINMRKTDKFNDFSNDNSVLLSTKELFQLLFSELSLYNSASAPFVDKILNSFTRLFIGEDTILLSDELLLNGLQQNSLFRSLNWQPVLLLTLSHLYKETISESGIGKAHYRVLQDYLLFCEKQQKIQEFEPLEKLRYLNSKLNYRIPKGIDYYRDLYTNAENLKVLLSVNLNISKNYDISKNNDISKNSSLRIVVSYIKGVLESANTDKIKALLDSKLPIYLINTLNTHDPHLRTSILEVFYLISQAFCEIKPKKNPEIEEINKSLGIITHISLYNEDSLDKSRFLECANEYFSLNKRIIVIFMKNLAQIFESPIVISI